MFGNKSHLITSFSNMDFKAGLLVFITLLVGSLAMPKPKDDMSIFFHQNYVNGRIIGGTEAAIGSHPHMVVLASGLLIRNFICGGSLISSRTVLTAAHCIDIATLPGTGSLSSTVRVIVGTNRYKSGGTTYSVVRGINHEDYELLSYKNDIGVLITDTEVVYNHLVQPVPLSFDYIDGGVPVILAGWGRISLDTFASADLLEMTSTTLESNDCVERVIQEDIDSFFDMYVDPRIELCTLRGPGFGACYGDSGSPLRRIDDGQQIGIVSWGFPCAVGAPDVFVRISAYESWLKSVTV